MFNLMRQGGADTVTCIVGIKHRGKVYIGGDSAGTSSTFQHTPLSGKKVVENGKIILGFAGDIRMAQILGHKFTPPYHVPDRELMPYLVAEFVDGMRQALKDAGVVYNTSGNESVYGECLIGIEGRLFKMQSNFSFVESKLDYDAAGAGQDVALGSLHETEGVMPEKRIHRALMASAKFNASVRAPFNIVKI